MDVKKVLKSTKGRTLLLSALLVGAVPTMNVVLADLAATKYPAAETYKPTPVPDRVVLTWKGDTATTQAVTWRTDTSVVTPQAQIAIAEDGPAFKAKATTVNAESTSEVKGNQEYTAKFHTVNFKSLQPETKYLYRVGDGINWSGGLNLKQLLTRRSHSPLFTLATRRMTLKNTGPGLSAMPIPTFLKPTSSSMPAT
ncbi:hypothetical protein D1B31_13945 [Neobacillus notoginsengisoli]|uniref:Purple acid phosphatase N-terminal domain-containing protein n=1 Tax=Neobacillus notoginsengisoli TaxID=1578198 RepID=A0A417YSU9_9BACI|nr:fibronectin type III domain-containing protein [Neobacillus notoginsengisoli]RHW39059.1 hypothetical protein D1B31_13945 [Neobacillus notoginsengisoli]